MEETEKIYNFTKRELIGLLGYVYEHPIVDADGMHNLKFEIEDYFDSLNN